MSDRSVGTVAVVSTGEMGQAVGRVLKADGLRVVTWLEGRSPRTVRLAAEAGIEGRSSLEAAVAEADLFFSLVPPACALELAQEVAAALRRTGSRLLYVDGNSIAPSTARRVAGILADAGGSTLDVSIVGPPPVLGRRESRTRFYVSGEEAEVLVEVARGLDVRPLPGGVGQASALKMCYAGVTKGLIALATELLVAAERLEVGEAVMAEMRSAQPALLDLIRQQVPRMPPKAYRWVGELEEMATTVTEVGLPPGVFTGAADLFRLVESSPLGAERPEDRRLGTSLQEVVRILADDPAPGGMTGWG
ncbi:MAG TPA: DUF1932 domain-containing protein [Candidatus Dormibacteraeota bacterium]|nr:DUF1932 domain-containing protein [Candidatus Dormibacteraeota bacterium]